MLFLRSLIDFPSNFHRLCIGFASALHWRNIGGSLEVHWRILPITKKNFAYIKENLLNNTAHCTFRSETLINTGIVASAVLSATLHFAKAR